MAGVIALSALPIAHAESQRQSPAVTAETATSATAPQHAVTADKDIAVSFSKPNISSKPASSAVPVRAVKSASSDISPLIDQISAVAPSPTAAQAPAPTLEKEATAPQPSSGFRPPLAAVNVTSTFGYRTNPLTGAAGELHTGIDFAGSCGTAVFAAGTGTVTEAGWSQYGGGNRIVIDHGGGIKTTYNHLATIGVSVGQQVSGGAQIGGVGTTGNSTGCHLHYEVMENGQTVNPASYL